MILGFAARWIGYTFAGAWIEHQQPDFLPNAKKHPPSIWNRSVLHASFVPILFQSILGRVGIFIVHPWT